MSIYGPLDVWYKSKPFHSAMDGKSFTAVHSLKWTAVEEAKKMNTINDENKSIKK